MHFWENHRFNTFVSGDLKGLPEHDPDYAQRMATPLFIFSKSKEGLATWTIWGVPTPPRSTNPLFSCFFSRRGGTFPENDEQDDVLQHACFESSSVV